MRRKKKYGRFRDWPRTGAHTTLPSTETGQGLELIRPCPLQRLAKDWSSYDLALYRDWPRTGAHRTLPSTETGQGLWSSFDLALYRDWPRTGAHTTLPSTETGQGLELIRPCPLQRLAKDWSSYDISIYADGSVKDGTEMGAGGILDTIHRQSDPNNHNSYAMPAGT